MWLMHVGKEEFGDVIQDVGKIVFPPNEPVEVKDEFTAKKIMEHCKLRGLVEVPIVRTGAGMTFDIKGASVAAQQALEYGQKKLVDNYIEEQKGRIAQNFPVLPPSLVVQKIAAEQGIDFREYGLTPPGIKINTTSADRIGQLEEMVKALSEQNRLLLSKFDEKNKRTQ
jgi:hypothetical protein